MKVRFKINDDGLLEDRSGNVLGRLESVVIDLSDGVIGLGTLRGGVVDCPSPSGASSSPPGQEALLPPEGVGTNPHRPSEVQVVWTHYQRVVPGGERYKLDTKRERIIRNALAVRPLATVLDAITGLSRSPHHLGQNDRRKKYLGIQYALAGTGNESNDERIDKMAAKANVTVADFIANLPSAGREMVKDHMNKVAASILHPTDANLVARAQGSATYLLSTFGLVPQRRGDVVEWSISTTGSDGT